ncbi:MAG: hypothetical protein M5U15_14550 [Kiritimatiellae bacterium]|nr:hypothetical protein [Kiritimatiellia bacterium]
MKRFLTILTLLAGFALSPAHAQQNLTADQADAYKAVIQADLARDNGAIAEAQRLYRQALDLYDAIARKEPNWHPEIVEYRVSYCRSQIEALKGRTEGDLPTDAARQEAKPDIALAEAQQRIEQLEAENEMLRNENEKAQETQTTLEADMEAVPKARLEAPELNAAREEARSLLEQVTTLSNQLVAIQLQYQSAAEQLAAERETNRDIESQLKQAQKDAKENDKLRDERDRLKKRPQGRKEKKATTQQTQTWKSWPAPRKLLSQNLPTAARPPCSSQPNSTPPTSKPHSRQLRHIATHCQS